jgi:dolichol-phosphate mannosyltransferase
MRYRDRVRHGVQKPANWWQLARFVTVGASGYVVNLATFALVVELIGLGHRAGAVIAFLVAVTNNFIWNRRWTFDARDGHAGRQAARFLTVSVAAFGVNLIVLELLILVGLPPVAAQALAVATATPCNFLGNKLWTFDA